MSDRLFDVDPPSAPLVGLVKGKTLLRHKVMGLVGVFREIFTVDDQVRYQVTVTDAGESGFRAGVPVSDRVNMWEKAG